MTTITQPAAEAPDYSVQQRRTLNTLRIAQIPGQAAVAGVIVVAALLATEMRNGNAQLGGSGGAAFTIGSALLAVPLSGLMRRRGRRFGLMLAFGLGAIGAAITGVAGQQGAFYLFLFGMLVFGGAQAATLQGRYVATDLAREHDRATAIATVVWMGTLGAVFGPILTPWERRLADNAGFNPLIGPYVAAFLFCLVAMTVVSVRMRPDPLAINGQLDPNAQRIRPLQQVRISAGVIRHSSLAPLGLAAMVISQTAMVAVMTMTPPHMKDHHHDDLSAFVISLHVLGMFGFAPVVGRGVARFGEIRSVMVGAVVLGAGTVVSVIAGYVPALIFVGLFLIGLGWSIGLIAGSSLLVGTVPMDSRVEVQGTADLTMSFCGGIAAFSSGFVKQAWQFHTLANAATIMAGLLLVAAYMQSLRVRRASLLVQ